MDAYVKEITSDNELKKFAKISQVNFNGDNLSYQVIFSTYYQTVDGSILKAETVERIIDSRSGISSPTLIGAPNVISDGDDSRITDIQTALSPIFDDILADYNTNLTTTTTTTSTTTTTTTV